MSGARSGFCVLVMTAGFHCAFLVAFFVCLCFSQSPLGDVSTGVVVCGTFCVCVVYMFAGSYIISFDITILSMSLQLALRVAILVILNG